MNVMFIYSLILYSKTLNTNRYDRYIERTLDWFMTQQITSDNQLLDGGFTYQEKVNVEPKMQNPVVIYNGIIAEYLAKIYEYYPENKIKISLERLEVYLYNNYDEKVGAFYHDYSNNKLLKNPYFIAGSSFVLKGLYEISRVLKKDNLKISAFLQKIINKYQYSNGSFRGFVGYNSSDNRKSCCDSLTVWEDIVPTVSWNAKMFELLSNIAEIKTDKLSESKLIIFSWNYFYFEKRNIIITLGIFPLKSIVLLIYRKKLVKPIFAFSLLDYYVKVRGLK